ncbi:MarR family winged helix-turn-helix transcriptional regulator [Streptomyces avicenniae]|uniref:MarR family winged helix-turn-helix transcriptional regulator n=1 Tax=Streptomyces avicenniae TaxID=500153 RepID=UPI00069BCF0F|nr:MarR family winged helix-turn-helix transcriptional regulator [Streptomyces avicenniae]
MSAQHSDPVVDEVASLVTQISERLRLDFNDTAAGLDLPPAQAIVVARLDEPAPMRRLAEWLSCDASNVTGIVDGLERRGLVERRTDPADRRVKMVALTDEGRRRRVSLGRRYHAFTGGLFDLPPEELGTLRDLLARVMAGADG